MEFHGGYNVVRVFSACRTCFMDTTIIAQLYEHIPLRQGVTWFAFVVSPFTDAVYNQRTPQEEYQCKIRVNNSP